MLGRIGLAAIAIVAVSWRSGPDPFRGACPRCTASSVERAQARVPIPQRAIVYAFAGEFATEGRWWLIDLDTGRVTLRRTTRDTSTTTTFNPLDAATLAKLRHAAVRTWRSKVSLRPVMAPGVFVEAYVVNGERAVTFNPLDPADGVITKAVGNALCGDERGC